ncbi:DDE-type integrase/transposase/recombinase [Marinomonas foliarum]|uniref:Transposase family protein n=1 Tax=Marinomonas foliarum TaxID=491950 RepID=A0ABX7IP64_9GAMM|nr:DDE-type integrase/transposase/recombinase [Marinomonas foliarum]QRV23408.1 transposase family protein [Marinomonas foliarum]
MWNIDFKGQAKLGNGHWCYPLTITDDFSRFLLCLEAQKSTKAKPVKENLERLFTDYGLPDVIKSDNGTPFATRAVGGLSNLSIWLIKLGITPERIEKESLPKMVVMSECTGR